LIRQVKYRTHVMWAPRQCFAFIFELTKLKTSSL
jgi:hypothetical protein